MKELQNLLHDLTKDTIDMTMTTMEFCPDTKIAECFPFTAYRTITLDGVDYQMKYEISLRKIKWS